MAEETTQSLRERNKQFVRDVVLDAAERLLRKNAAADFSMRELAAEAGVGFATPFNHFGSKNAIMQALSSRVIERMTARFREEAPSGDAIDRVLAMGSISIALLLEQPEVSKAVVGSLGLAGPVPSSVRPQSEAIWSLALDDLKGIEATIRSHAREVLPQQLAFMFRGCLSFWIAGELDDNQFREAFEAGASTLLLGFADRKRRPQILERIKPVTASGSASPAQAPRRKSPAPNSDKRR
jgi:AcrR family transcriptional regulator